MEKENYYNKRLSAIYQSLETSEHGLGKAEAQKRFLRYGPNKLPEAKADSIVLIFFRQFQSPLIFILLISAGAVFLAGERMDGLVIFSVLFFNAIVGTIQEGKARNIFLALRNFIKSNASVIRNEEEYIISEEEITLGDVIVLREGEKIPADGRILHSESLQVDEAALTGESNPKFKISADIKKDNIAISDQKNMVFKGTSVVFGNGKAIVTAIGSDTVIGAIANKISGIDEDLPLKKNIRRLSRFIIFSVFLIGMALFGIGLAYGHPIKEIFITIVAVSVSIIPEGLPIVVTLVLAAGVWRMGKRNVLVKKLQAVEALGQINVIATDKTGTITKNELTVEEVYIGGKNFLVQGVGYEPKGEIELNGKIIEPLNHPELLLAGKIGALCSSAHSAFDNDLGIWKISGDPTEAATLVFSQKIGFNRGDLQKEFIKIEEKPFDYKLKYHAILYQEKSQHILMAVGAPEEILDISNLDQKKEEELRNVFVEMSARGLRVVALGMKNVSKDYKIPDKLSKIDFVGFLGIKDLPREEVREAVEKVRGAQIGLVMITGDYRITAKAIAKEIGIFQIGDKIIEGMDVDRMSVEELSQNLEGVSVFARTNPLHKLKIINAYKLAGKTIAMTGDGVNDALSLTSADVGVAMGKIGTEVAKEASDIILLDDNFGSIVSGIEEGRNIYKTIKRVILYLFSTNVGEVLTIIGAIILGFPLPILAVQILWLNLVTDGFLDVSLAMEPKGDKFLGKEFAHKKPIFIDKLMILRIFTMAFPMAIGI